MRRTRIYMLNDVQLLERRPARWYRKYLVGRSNDEWRQLTVGGCVLSICVRLDDLIEVTAATAAMSGLRVTWMSSCMELSLGEDDCTFVHMFKV